MTFVLSQYYLVLTVTDNP